MRVLWIVGMVISGLAVVVFSDPGTTAALTVMTFGLVLVAAPILMNLWIPLILMVPVMVFRSNGFAVLGVLFAAVLALVVVLLDTFMIAQDRTRLIPEQGPELAALALPPRSIEFVARNWQDLGVASRHETQVCGPVCAELLTVGGIDWLRVRFEDGNSGARHTYRIQAAPASDCMARLPGYEPGPTCLLFQRDDGATADLVVHSTFTPRDTSNARVHVRQALRTVITDTRAGGDVVHDRTHGVWDVAVAPPFLAPRASMQGGPWAIRRVMNSHTQTALPALGVLMQAAVVPTLATVTDAGGKDTQGSGQAGPWRAALIASAHDLRAAGFDQSGRLAREIGAFYRDHLFGRPLAPHEQLLRWQLATSRATRDNVSERRARTEPPTSILPDVPLLLDALESPGFGTRQDVAAAIASQVVAAPPQTYAPLSDRYLAAMASDEEVRREMLPAAARLGPAGAKAQRDAAPTLSLHGRARIILAACIGDMAQHEDHALSVQAVMDQMIAEFPTQATGPGTRGRFDDTFRFGIQVLRHLDRPDLVEAIRAAIDWEGFATTHNSWGEAASSVDRIQRLYFDAPQILDCPP